MNSHETFDWVETRVDIHDSIIAKHLKLYICFGDRTLNYLLSVAGGSPNEDSSGYPTNQSPGFGQWEKWHRRCCETPHYLINERMAMTSHQRSVTL